MMSPEEMRRRLTRMKEILQAHVEEQFLQEEAREIEQTLAQQDWQEEHEVSLTAVWLYDDYKSRWALVLSWRVDEENARSQAYSLADSFDTRYSPLNAPPAYDAIAHEEYMHRAGGLV